MGPADYSIELMKQARFVKLAQDIFRRNSRRLGLRDNEVQILMDGLKAAEDSLSLAAGCREASRAIGEFRP